MVRIGRLYGISITTPMYLERRIQIRGKKRMKSRRWRRKRGRIMRRMRRSSRRIMMKKTRGE